MPELALFEIQMKFPAFLLACISAGMIMLMPKFMDATDALGAAYCHFLQMNRPETDAKHYSSWKDFATKNQSRIKK